MFGIGGGELIFIILVILMLFGSDKIPEIARMMGKTMRQVKDATEGIKQEIRKGADEQGLKESFESVQKQITQEVDSAKDIMNTDSASLEKTREDIEEIVSGPIKRQH